MGSGHIILSLFCQFFLLNIKCLTIAQPMLYKNIFGNKTIEKNIKCPASEYV
jgi:hypothetical protein